MKRSPALAPLSRDHHVALEAALTLRRASEENIADAVARFRSFFDERGRRHFEIEETLLLPAVEPDERWKELSARVLLEHQRMREAAEQLAAGSLSPGETVGTAHELGQLLHDHVRFEERQLFELLESRLRPGALDDLGRAVERAERS